MGESCEPSFIAVFYLQIISVYMHKAKNTDQRKNNLHKFVVESRRIELRSHPCHGCVLAVIRRPRSTPAIIQKLIC